MATINRKTTKPSGLSVARSTNKFTISWKCADKNYDGGQVLNYAYVGSGGYLTYRPSLGARSYTFTLSASSFYPTIPSRKLTEIKTRIAAKCANYTQGGNTYVSSNSDWTNLTYTVAKPNKPKVTATVGTWPQMTFAWTVTTSNTDNKWFTDVQYRSILVKDSEITDGSKLDWTTSEATMIYNTGSASGSITVTEDSSQLGDGHSYTRWFKVRSRGPAGASGWVYAKHVYALPLKATITDWDVTENTSANGYTVQVFFDSPKTVSRPIDEVAVQYAIAVPDTGMVCPSGASWNTGSSVKVKDDTSGATFAIDSTLAADQCLFVRANTIYDSKTTYGNPVMVDIGALADPDDLTVVTDGTQYTATVSADNNSTQADAYLVVRYYSYDEPDGVDIGIIESGESSVVVQCPHWSSVSNIQFGVYAAVGDYTTNTRADGVMVYQISPVMLSGIVKSGGSVPAAPATVTAYPTTTSGTIRVIWDWSWSAADRAEISWSDHADAWESTDEPDTYTITKMKASAWNISGLATGITWYIRVRLISGSSDSATYGAYSDMVAVDLSSAPTAPVLSLSDGIITADGSVTATWAYSTTDGTAQAFAEVAEVTTVQGTTTYTTLAEVETAQHVTITASEVGWTTGSSHALAVRVTSASGRLSDGWSAPAVVQVADPISCTITSTSLEDVTITSEDEEGDPVTLTVKALTELPLTATVTGASDDDTTMLIIERAAAYHVDRPDETDYNGYEGETVVLYSQNGSSQISIGLADLIGHLDDEAKYRLIATVSDVYGQSASDSIDFEVHWDHQAEVPAATTELDLTNMAAKLTPVAPDGAEETDVCDIYRLSVDKPQLIYEGAEFGETYVDPYPTFGRFGGHRFVTRTANGDYITGDGEFAWYDTRGTATDTLNSEYNLIEFGSGNVKLRHNIDLSSDWQKDFKQTKYLGGSVQGDWNAAVTRSGGIGAVVIAEDDPELIESLRRLAAYPGICHVRTKDGSSYAADVQVSESLANAHNVPQFNLKINKVDQQALEGMTLDEWNDLHEESHSTSTEG